MNHQRVSSNQTSRKTRFALRFIRALTRIKMSTTPTMGTLQKQSRKIKFASDASMASVVGSKRSWSHAILLKIRNRARIHALCKQKVVIKKNKKKKYCNKRDVLEEEIVGANQLRRIVPGGESMDFLNLLGETAHYIKCLNTQVEVMKNIVDLYSSPST